MKWLGVLKFFAHPSLLPLAISTFISIAGPGGVAEISRHAPVVATVPTIDAPHVVAAPSEPLILVLRPVSPQTPPDTTSPAAPTAPVLNTQSSHDLRTLASETPPVSDGDGQPEVPDAAPVPVASTEVPEDPPTNSGDESVPPVPEEPDDPIGDDTEVPGGDDSSAPDGNDDQDGDSSGDDQPVCDPPGNGPDPHDGVPPGHDQNDDGIDDRCQDATDDDTSDDGSDNDDTGNAGDDAPNDGSDNGDDAGNDDGADDDGLGDGDDASDDGSDGDDVSGDDGAENDEPACDPPGNGPAPHGDVPPGHDKNEDGIDDRCQEGGSETDGESDGGQKDKNKREHDTRFTIALLRRI